MRYFNKLPLSYVMHILMVVCVVNIICFAFILFNDTWEYDKGDAVYHQLRLKGELSQLPVGKTSLVLQDVDDVLSEKKNQEHIDEIDFTFLEGINPDVVGWIASEGTKIDYPVVQGQDNDFYIHHLFTGERNKLGSIFMDYRNQGDFSDKNTIIYGHNMKDGSMFSSLTKYKDQQYYDSFPTMMLYTPDGDFMIELFAGIIAEGNYELVRFDFLDNEDFQSYINILKKKSTFKSNTIVKEDERIITLCTCTYEFDNARFILFGALKPQNDN